MSKPTISVIVPVYNTESQLRRSIDSILAQTFKDFELILVDDGSTDRSGKICDEYAVIDSRIKVFHKVNGGVCSARNLGIEKSNGNWISFIDSDDYIEDSFFMTFLDYKEDLENGVLLVQGISFDNGLGTSEILHKGISRKCTTIEYIANGAIGYSVNKLYQSSILQKNSIRWDERFRCLEDELFVLDYLRHIDYVQYIDCAHYHYLIPADFDKKYNISLLPVHLERYKKFKSIMDNSDVAKKYLYGPLLSITLVDTIARMGQGEYFDDLIIHDLVNTVSEDVGHIQGLKHLPLRILALSKNIKYWKFWMKSFSLFA